MRPGSIEAKILSEIRTAGGWSAVISNYGPSTGRTIDRLETKGWIETHGDGWRVLPAAPQTQGT